MTGTRRSRTTHATLSASFLMGFAKNTRGRGVLINCGYFYIQPFQGLILVSNDNRVNYPVSSAVNSIFLTDSVVWELDSSFSY